MYRLIVIFLLSGISVVSSAQNQDGVLAMFWNLENFFDYRDSGKGESDREFSSFGSRRWTKSRFYIKCDAISKAIMWTGERYGRMPDVIGVAEVENRWVLSRLLESTLLRKFDYKIVHFESCDRRGIDVALLYRTSSFELISSNIKIPVHEGEKMNTRDILHVRLRSYRNEDGYDFSDGDIYDFIVNHHPSKFGGSEESENKRFSAMRTLKMLCDSLSIEKSPKIVAMGDFNDNPDAPAFSVIGPQLFNKSLELHRKGEGTIRYEGKWDLIDMFLVSRNIADKAEMEICRIPFLMTRDRKHPGEKPLRTYSGPRYLGGVSDHCPIIMKIYD